MFRWDKLFPVKLDAMVEILEWTDVKYQLGDDWNYIKIYEHITLCLFINRGGK